MFFTYANDKLYSQLIVTNSSAGICRRCGIYLCFLFIYISLKLFIEPKKKTEKMFRSLVIRNHISYRQMICWIQLDFCECVFVFVKLWRRRTGTTFVERIQINQSIKSNWQSLNQGQIFWSNIYTNSFWYAQQTTVFHSVLSFQTHNIIYALRYSDDEWIVWFLYRY